MKKNQKHKKILVQNNPQIFVIVGHLQTVHFLFLETKKKKENLADTLFLVGPIFSKLDPFVGYSI